MEEKLLNSERAQIPKNELDRLTNGLAWERHPLSAKFPMMSLQEYVRLRESIRDSVNEGLITRENPIKILIYEDKVLEGWNRYVACNELTRQDNLVVPLEFGEFAGSEQEALKLVFRENFNRRHLSTEDKVRIALEIDDSLTNGEQQESTDEKEVSNDTPIQPVKQKKGRQAERVAKLAGVGSATVNRVKKKIKKAQGKTSKKVPEKDMESVKNRIIQICGEEQWLTIGMNHHDPELVKFAKLDDEEMRSLAGYLAAGMTVKEAQYAAPKKLTTSHTIKQAIQRAVANGGTYSQSFPAHGDTPEFTIEVNQVLAACEV